MIPIPGITPSITKAERACPFCGAQAPRLSTGDGSPRVACEPCGAYGPIGRDEADAVRLWERSPQDALENEMNFILGLDIGFAALGWAVMALDGRPVVDNNSIRYDRVILAAGVILTKKATAKCYASMDHVWRIGLLLDELEKRGRGVQAICYEMPGGTQSVQAGYSFGVGETLVVALGRLLVPSGRLPIVGLTATQVKVGLTGNKHATKADMIAVAHQHWHEWPKAKGPHEHIADAIGVCFAARLFNETIRVLDR